MFITISDDNIVIGICCINFNKQGKSDKVKRKGTAPKPIPNQVNANLQVMVFPAWVAIIIVEIVQMIIINNYNSLKYTIYF